MEIIAEIEKKSGRGGAREGAGRKKTTVKSYYLRATKEVAEILDAVDGSKSAFVNDCILKAMGKK